MHFMLLMLFMMLMLFMQLMLFVLLILLMLFLVLMLFFTSFNAPLLALKAERNVIRQSELKIILFNIYYAIVSPNSTGLTIK